MSHSTPPSSLKMGIPIPNSKLGLWLFLGTEIMFFTAFIGAYLVLRIGSPGWPTDPKVTHILVAMGAINTLGPGRQGFQLIGITQGIADPPDSNHVDDIGHPHKSGKKGDCREASEFDRHYFSPV